jgi:hypothetical protein
MERQIVLASQFPRPAASTEESAEGFRAALGPARGHSSSGTRLSPYEALSQIGAVGMGAVYRARDTRLRREVVAARSPAVTRRVSRRVTASEPIHLPGYLNAME